MDVLFVSAEAVPFAKVGGMADVVGSLPAALQQQDVDARIIMPGYGHIDHNRYQISHLFSFQQTLHTGTADVHVYSSVHNGIPIYFVQAWPYFGQEATVYTDWNWDVPRYIFFNQIVLGVIWQLNERFGWFPDVVHVNDWHTGLLPFLMQEAGHLDPIWRSVGTLLSIHNLSYQGDHVGGFLWQAGVPGRHHPDLVYQDLTDNLLAIAIAYSDIVTTVSPRYAIEIQYSYMGTGLENLIRTRVTDLYGILNGIDVDTWNPATDPHIVQNFDVATFHEQRIVNKRHLQRSAELEVRDDVLLVGMISRLVWQKGIDLAVPALRQFLAGYDVQFIGLGTGNPDYENQMRKLENDFGWRARAYLQFDAAVAQQIYAGSDLFLMPSHFEPCGTGQMIAMRYGALPLVRETGGLADTVENYDNGDGNHGTGFVFQWEEVGAVTGTLRWAHDTFTHKPDAWRRMQRRAMQRDFSWRTSARSYIDLYQKAIEKRRETGEL